MMILPWTSKVSPDWAPTHSPLMYDFSMKSDLSLSCEIEAVSATPLVEAGKYATHIRLAVSHGVESLCGGRGRDGEGIAKTRSQKLSRNRTDKAIHSDKRAP